jgi:hypothetical protein
MTDKVDGWVDTTKDFIWGWIQPDEYTTTEYLVKWYKWQGFQVYEAKLGKYQILLEFKGEGE